jgi:hypothetical protein
MQRINDGDTMSGIREPLEPVIQQLESWRDDVIQGLRDHASDECVRLKVAIEQAANLLRLAEEWGITPACRVNQLPPHGSGYAEYRIMCDHESDDRENWTEVKLDGEHLRLCPGDLIVETT